MIQKEDLAFPPPSHLYDGELHENTLLTSLLPESHWSAGQERGGGRAARDTHKYMKNEKEGCCSKVNLGNP